MNVFDYLHDPFLMQLDLNEKEAIVERLRVWGQMTQPFCKRLDNWFSNFDDIHDKRLALKTFHNLKFYSHDDFANRLRQLYGSIERHLSETKNSPSDIILVVPDGHGDSADRHAYELIKQWSLLRDQIYTVSELAHKSFLDPVFVLFNDTHGTGNQFLRDIWPGLSHYGEHKIYVLAIAIAEEALNNFRKEIPRVHVIPGIPVTNAKTIFNGGEYLRLQEIGLRVYPKHPMGYGDAGLLTAYYFQCPNNTIPIVWADGQNNETSGKAYSWNPLFPYMPKKNIGTTGPSSRPQSTHRKSKSHTVILDKKSQSAVVKYRYRVAMLNLDLDMTNFNGLALSLNSCQNFFHFVCLPLSNRALTAKAVLEFAGQKNLSVYNIDHQFFDEFGELAVDVVACFTEYPLAFVDKVKGVDEYNYFSGPSNVDGRFMFISANQLRQFVEKAERSFEEGLAYILISQLAVHFSDLGCCPGYHHDTKDCPMDFCAIRSDMIGGLKKREFCKTCNKEINNEELRSAFEAILNWNPTDTYLANNIGSNHKGANTRAYKEASCPYYGTGEIDGELIDLADQYLAVSIPDWAAYVNKKNLMVEHLTNMVLSKNVPKRTLAIHNNEGVLVALAGSVFSRPEPGDMELLFIAARKIEGMHAKYHIVLSVGKLFEHSLVPNNLYNEVATLLDEFEKGADEPLAGRIELTRTLITR